MGAHVAYRGPSVIKEIFYGISIGLAAGFLWKVHHWNLQKRTKEFYEMLDRGEISVVVEEDDECFTVSILLAVNLYHSNKHNVLKKASSVPI